MGSKAGGNQLKGRSIFRIKEHSSALYKKSLGKFYGKNRTEVPEQLREFYFIKECAMKHYQIVLEEE